MIVLPCSPTSAFTTFDQLRCWLMLHRPRDALISNPEPAQAGVVAAATPKFKFHIGKPAKACFGTASTVVEQVAFDVNIPSKLCPVSCCWIVGLCPLCARHDRTMVVILIF
eukprot:NODE_3613_length_424_cov_5.872000_g3179_i0.p1 GENE.NODE_3613_length_424_cov_5.872000_g3179_i0~~NODE_3613_length_424_cov_5.872000_g3179_i0.p1  ORF type:complete len:111 (+),score=0.25 NODE_3613_length_424_cov_5.872000_g3179_i0:43-375(+)